MAFSGQVSIDKKGLNKVLNALDALPLALRKSAEKAVLRAGAKPILKAAKARVPVGTGLLKKSLGISVSASRSKGSASARVGPRSRFVSKTNKSGRKGKGDKAIKAQEYAFYVEMGTPHASAQPFIRPAIDSAQGEVLEAMTTGLSSYLTKVAARVKK